MKFYELTPTTVTTQHIINSGYTKPDYFRAYEYGADDTPSRWSDKIMVDDNGEVHLSAEIIKIFCNERIYFRPSLKCGRRKFYPLAQIFDDLYDHATYEPGRKSVKQEWVNARNIAILDYLVSLAY